MQPPSEDWTELNAAFDSILSPRLPQAIEKILIDQYQVIVDCSDLSVYAHSAIEVRKHGEKLYEIHHDYRHRSAQAFHICEYVGRSVNGCQFDDSGFHLSITDGSTLTVRRDDEFENFEVWLTGMAGPYCV